jgi:N6-L-threonylcarbamoyladenine synthase
MLGLPYPGGPALEKLAREGDATAFDFPTAKRVTGLDFSFAGLKTALLYALRDLGDDPPRADLAASYQDAIVRALVERCERALDETGLTRLALGGGVAANGPLREAAAKLADEVHVPPVALCTDNAAMIGSAARWVDALPYPEYLGLDAYATGEDPQWR